MLFIEQKVESVEKDNIRLRTQIVYIQAENSKLNANVSNLLERISQPTSTQHSRKSNIRVCGIPDDDQDETAKVTMNKTCDILKMKVTVSDIDIAHRLGRITKAKKPKPIIVRCKGRTTKTEVMEKRSTALDEKIYIREDLTRYNQNVLSETRYDGRVEYAYSREGKLYVKLCSLEYPRQVKCFEDIDNLEYESIYNNYP